MASRRAQIFNKLIFLMGFKKLLSDTDKLTERLAKWKKRGPALPSAKFRRKFKVSEIQYDGYRVFTISPRNTKSDKSKQVFYLHGGGYVIDILRQHWNFVNLLVEATGATVTVPIYPKAPEHTCLEVIRSTDSLLDDLVEKFGADNFTMMGDSAGAGLTLSVAHYRRDSRKPMPAKLVLLSPWLDVTASNPCQSDIERKDPMIALAGLRLMGELYAGDIDPSDARVSPLFGTHEQLPPTQLFTGTLVDSIYPDSRRFRDKMAEIGGSLEYNEFEGMLHAWMIFPLPESKQVIQKISKFLK